MANMTNSSAKRIERSIDDLCEFIESCKPKFLSQNEVVVPRDKFNEKIDEMRLRIPDEVRRCNKIIEQRDKIISEAEAKAQKIIEDAGIKADAMVHDSEIMRQAYLQANEYLSRATQQADETVANANYEAQQIHQGALEYTKEMLMSIENVLRISYNETKIKTDELLNVLYQNLDIVSANRKELVEDVAPQDESESFADDTDEEGYQYEGDEDMEGYEEEDDDDFNPDSDAFLRNID